MKKTIHEVGEEVEETAPGKIRVGYLGLGGSRKNNTDQKKRLAKPSFSAETKLYKYTGNTKL